MLEAAGGRMSQATLASLLIHVLAALAIPALVWSAAATTPVETVSFTHILHIEVKPPRAFHPPPRALAPRHEVRPTLNFANRVHLVAVRPHRHPAPDRALASTAPAAPVVATVQEAGSGASTGAAAPQVTPSPAARAAVSVGSRQTGGYLPFGAEQPDPVLDPSVRKALDGLGTHVTLIVTVGDDGRTQSVTFEPPIDPSLETQIRALLADANWDPAVCGGGVACQGQATIKL
jgi:hypothetical protein